MSSEFQKLLSEQGKKNWGSIVTPSGKPFGMPQSEWNKINANKPYRPKVRKNLVRDPKTKQMVDRDE